MDQRRPEEWTETRQAENNAIEQDIIGLNMLTPAHLMCNTFFRGQLSSDRDYPSNRGQQSNSSPTEVKPASCRVVALLTSALSEEEVGETSMQTNKFSFREE